MKTLTTTKAAKIKGWSPSTMLRAVEAGKFKAFKTPGGHWRIDIESLRAGPDKVAEVHVQIVSDLRRLARAGSNRTISTLMRQAADEIVRLAAR